MRAERALVAYDDVKHFGQRAYSGMRVGARHDWDYTDGRWQETKTAPDAWSFTFRSQKRRRHRAPPGSGAPDGTMFHWFLLAHQRVRKVDADTYETFMEGTKWKVAHRRPAWQRWSSEHAPNPRARARVAEILEETARGLRAQDEAGAPRLENALDPRVLSEGKAATLDAWIDER
jgi:hypothetical protein